MLILFCSISILARPTRLFSLAHGRFSLRPRFFSCHRAKRALRRLRLCIFALIKRKKMQNPSWNRNTIKNIDISIFHPMPLRCIWPSFAPQRRSMHPANSSNCIPQSISSVSRFLCALSFISFRLFHRKTALITRFEVETPSKTHVSSAFFRWSPSISGVICTSAHLNSAGNAIKSPPTVERTKPYRETYREWAILNTKNREKHTCGFETYRAPDEFP